MPPPKRTALSRSFVGVIAALAALSTTTSPIVSQPSIDINDDDDRRSRQPEDGDTQRANKRPRPEPPDGGMQMADYMEHEDQDGMNRAAVWENWVEMIDEQISISREELKQSNRDTGFACSKEDAMFDPDLQGAKIVANGDKIVARMKQMLDGFGVSKKIYLSREKDLNLHTPTTRGALPVELSRVSICLARRI